MNQFLFAVRIHFQPTKNAIRGFDYLNLKNMSSSGNGFVVFVFRAKKVQVATLKLYRLIE